MTDMELEGLAHRCKVYDEKLIARLLEERKRVLDELRRQACPHNKRCGNPNCAKIAAAIAFAEEAANP